MKIDGRKIAEREYERLSKKVGELRKNGIIPHLAVILVGKDPASVAYVEQKRKYGEHIGARVSVLEYDERTNTDELASKLRDLNQDPLIHGIIVQEPLPVEIDARLLQVTTDPRKDVDGFHPDTRFTPPLPLAVMEILKEIKTGLQAEQELFSWLRTKVIAVIGKGETGGGPVIAYLEKQGMSPLVIDSHTEEPERLLLNADIVISAVGERGVLIQGMLKKGVILIGIGIFRGEDGKLHGDYSEEEVKDIASFYTPVPGGVGPVNVAMLLNNLVRSASGEF